MATKIRQKPWAKVLIVLALILIVGSNLLAIQAQTWTMLTAKCSDLYKIDDHHYWMHCDMIPTVYRVITYFGYQLLRVRQ